MSAVKQSQGRISQPERSSTPPRNPRLQRAYEREWKRHPAQIELLQTIVLRLSRLIELQENRDASPERLDLHADVTKLKAVCVSEHTRSEP